MIICKPKLLGGSINLAFINANGMPTGTMNMHKWRDMNNFIKGNHLTTIIETGCTNKGPKLLSTKYKTC